MRPGQQIAQLHRVARARRAGGTTGRTSTSRPAALAAGLNHGAIAADVGTLAVEQRGHDQDPPAGTLRPPRSTIRERERDHRCPALSDPMNMTAVVKSIPSRLAIADAARGTARCARSVRRCRPRRLHAERGPITRCALRRVRTHRDDIGRRSLRSLYVRCRPRRSRGRAASRSSRVQGRGLDVPHPLAARDTRVDIDAIRACADVHDPRRPELAADRRTRRSAGSAAGRDSRRLGKSRAIGPSGSTSSVYATPRGSGSPARAWQTAAARSWRTSAAARRSRNLRSTSRRIDPRRDPIAPAKAIDGVASTQPVDLDAIPERDICTARRRS